MQTQPNTASKRPAVSTAKRCDTCNADCPNEDSYQSHISGRRHQSMIAKLDSRHKRDERTIFVSGKRDFDKLSELALSDYFSSIGPIRRVSYLKERGFAFVEFAQQSSVDRAVANERHVINIGRLSCTVFVRICRQSTPQQVLKNDQQFKMRQQECEDRLRGLKETSLPAYDEKLAKVIENGADLAGQILLLSSEIGLTDDSLLSARQCVRQIQSLVNSFISPNGPKICRACIFGSKVSTLGLRSSDVDVVLLFNPETLLSPVLLQQYCIEDTEEIGEDLESVSPIKQMRMMNRLDKSSLPLAERSAKSKTSEIASMLGCCLEFSSILNIKARIPIVRCLHGPTQSQVDISVDSLLSVNNSHLLRLYSLYDHRIRPLILAIRYWAKIQGICPAPNHLTSYALTLLVLYFLQTRNPPVCPTVSELGAIAKKTGEPEVILSTWNATYPLDLAKWPMTQNTESLNDLFPSFFDFFANFSFNESAIILRDASTVSVQTLVASAEAAGGKKSNSKPGANKPAPKQQVKSADACSHETTTQCETQCCCNCVKEEPLPVAQEPAVGTEKPTNSEANIDDDEPEGNETFRVSVMNVQDPIELCRNVTGSINSRVAQEIQGAFKAAAQVLHTCDRKDKAVLRQLLKKIEVKPPAKKESPLPQKQKAKGKTLTIALSPNNNVIHSRSLEWFRQIRIPGADLTLRWLCSAVGALGVVHLFHKVMLFDISVIHNKVPSEVWQVVNAKMAADLGISRPDDLAVSARKDTGVIPMFVPPAIPSSSGSSKHVEGPIAESKPTTDKQEVLLQLELTARYSTWHQREEMATLMRRQGRCPKGPNGGFEEIVADYGLAFETQVSKSIAFGDGSRANKTPPPPVTFTATFSLCASAANRSQDEIRLELVATSITPSNLFSSLSSFLTKRFSDAVSALS